MDESKLLFRNFTVQHSGARNCTKGRPGECHFVATIPDGDIDLIEWDQKVCQFVGEALQKAFNEMVENAKKV